MGIIVTSQGLCFDLIYFWQIFLCINLTNMEQKKLLEFLTFSILSQQVIFSFHFPNLHIVQALEYTITTMKFDMFR